MSTNFKGTTKEINALNVYIKLIRSSESLSSRINLILDKKGLTISQFAVMDVLYNLGSLSQKDLGKKILRSGGNITMVVDNLEKQSLVERERSQDDRRYFIIHLTKKGKKFFEKIFPIFLHAVVKEFDVLSEKEQIEFQRMCKLVGLKEGK
ncbi:MAG: MarR family winged helix-turn-helix transcriptional regulator [Ignavibacteriaceae bacterium]